jgi:hypothetical protein
VKGGDNTGLIKIRHSSPPAPAKPEYEIQNDKFRMLLAPVLTLSHMTPEFNQNTLSPDREAQVSKAIAACKEKQGEDILN